MKKGKLSRRSFLHRVSSGALALGPMGVITGQAYARQTSGVTDSDSGASADPFGNGRGTGTGITDSDLGPSADPVGRGRGTSQRNYSGITDADGGPNADPLGNGRGSSSAPGRNRTGLTDSDSGSTADAAEYGMRGGGNTGLTDSDLGANADPVGNGRGRGSGPAGQRHTGVTDSDGGQSADPVGYGRGGGTGITDADQGASADPAGRGRGTLPGGNQGYTGRTDHDTRDRRGYGGTYSVRDTDLSDGTRPPGSRQRAPNSGYSDQDPTDLSGRGVRGRRLGVSDNDYGTYGDPVGRGRGNPNLTRRRTGLTDRDTGNNADPAGYGRGGR